MTAPLADAEARRRIAEDLDSTFVVEAAAGTGKTTALIGRMIAILRTGRARLEEIVAVTFTEKAAGEMKLRLRGELEAAHAAAADGAERARFEAALAELEAARIGTIHSFCADLLRERPVEAGVDPEVEVITEEQERALVERAFGRWFEARLSDPPEGVRRMLRRRGRSPREQLLRAARDLVSRRDHPAPWRRDPFDRAARIDALLEELRGVAALAELASAPSDYLAGDLRRIARFVADVDDRERVRPRDYDGLEAELVALARDREAWKHRGFGNWYGEGLLRADVLARREAVREALEAFVADAGADLAACLKADLAPVVEAYDRLKARTGTLDFLDLLIRARDLIRDDAAVREELRGRFARIFVDEFQDTDPLQAEILLLLASDGPVPAAGVLSDEAPAPVPGKLFVVGDPKQSIYRFRRADVGLYERVKRRLMERGVERLTLSTSFRATPDIQRAINAAFEPLMQGAPDGSQASYVALREHRAAPVDRPSVIALPVPRPYGRWGKVFKKHVEASSADAVGAFVDWLLNESGWTVEDPLSGEARPFESRDVCLLFRNTSRFGRSVVQPYVLGLEARGIPHVLVGGRAFHDREEVLALAAVLRAIERPDDTVSVYAALRGPFFALSDEQLLLHREQVGPLHPLVPAGAALWDPARRPVAEALEILRELHVHRNRRPIADTIARFLDATRAHAGIANWPNGEQALSNVLRVLELARSFEAQGALSFRAFVERLDDRLARGEGVDAPVVEERAAGVRIMTVHKAKGLELPVVVLCDPTLPRTVDRPSRHVDADAELWAAPLAGCAPVELTENREAVLRADEAEEVRLTYVAATRARDLLVVPCVGDGPEEGWVDPLHRALYPAEERRRDAEPAPGCPAFGDDSVLERTERVRWGTERSVKPGLHRIGDGAVVWWDPFALALGRLPRGGLRRTGLLAPGQDGDAGAEQVEAHLAWVERREALRERGAAPSWKVRPVTAVAHALAEPSGDAVGPQVGLALAGPGEDAGDAGAPQVGLALAGPGEDAGDAGAPQVGLALAGPGEDAGDAAASSARPRASTSAAARAGDAAPDASSRAGKDGGAPGAPSRGSEPGGAAAARAARRWRPRIEQTAAVREGRPGGTRFGTLVHAVLAECALDAGEAEVAAMARHQARLLGAPDEEVRAAVEAATAALAHPILEAAREAEARGECRRESPITVPLEDGTSAEGVVDLAYRADGRWCVVDFKTDRETGEKAVHTAQLAIYAEAVHAATGEDVETVLLYV
jgi:ATP-dependent exoDNAse (exonuclease V) beta subunit